MNPNIAPASLRQRAQNYVSALLRRSLLRDSRYYYDQYYGTDNALVLGVKNVVRPTRFLTKLLYGQIVPLPNALSLATAVAAPPLSEEWQQHLRTLRRDGIVFVPGFFATDAGLLAQRYQLNPQAFPSSDKYTRFYLELSDPEVLKLATHPMLLGLLAGYYRCQPYLRQMPAMNCTHADSENARQSVGFNNFWHYDTANQTTAHILMNDCAESDSCMLYAKGTHRTHRVQLAKEDYYYSEAYVRDHFEVVPCVGTAGTLVIFDPNGLHRVDLKARTFRAHLHLNFVPGNNVVKAKSGAAAGPGSPSSFDMQSLTHLQKSSLARMLTGASAENA